MADWVSWRLGKSWYEWEEVDGEVGVDFFANGGSHDCASDIVYLTKVGSVLVIVESRWRMCLGDVVKRSDTRPAHWVWGATSTISSLPSGSISSRLMSVVVPRLSRLHIRILPSKFATRCGQKRAFRQARGTLADSKTKLED